MTIDRVDFLRRLVSVVQQVVTVRRHTTIAAPKTSASVRSVPLADVVAGELAVWVTLHPRQAGQLLVCGGDGLHGP
jgi:hypothetical protein